MRIFMEIEIEFEFVKIVQALKGEFQSLKMYYIKNPF